MKYLLFFICFSFVLIPTISQTTTINQPANFSSTNQGMFGPNSNFNLNFELPLFHVPWSNSFSQDQTVSTIVGTYGYQVSGGTSGYFGAKFYSRNWNDGNIDVNYPVNIQIGYPSNSSFERGETITLTTSYDVDPSAQLLTTFPQTGNVGLELNFGLRFYLTPLLCFVSCTQVGAFDTGNLSTTLTIFDVSQNQVEYACLSPTLTCYEQLLPAEVNAGFGLSGTFDLPNVQTTSSIRPDQCLEANGEDAYARVQLEIFKLIGAMNIPGISNVLNNLSRPETCFFDDTTSTYNVCYEYTLLSAAFGMDVVNKQDFVFCPEIYTNIKFPIPVQYTVTNPSNGNSIVEGPSQSDSIRVKVGNNINFTYPCNYEYMNLSTVHEIENTISNHTYDELQFNFTMKALSFSIKVDGFGNGENTDDSTSSVDDWSYSVGPLFQNSIPLGTLDGFEWYNDSWELPGFDSIIGQPFQLNPNQYLASTGATTNVNCKGESTGVFTANVTNGTSPYIYNWSDGSSNTSSSTSQTNNTLNAGNHHVVIEDANGCMSYASYNVTEPTSPLQIGSSVITPVSCNGNNDGQVSLAVSGGTGSYSYNWSSGSGSNTISNIGGGNQSVTITDANGCELTQSFTIPEPSTLAATFEIKNVSCFGGNDGEVEVITSGGNAPFSYSWSNGATTKITNDWAAGSHSVTITDIKGCSNTISFTVNQPASALNTTAAISNVNCYNGNDGSLNGSTNGGTPPYNYQWADENYNSHQSYTDIANGLYASNWTAIVTDANRCIKRTTFPVTQPSAPLYVDITPSHVSCRNGNNGMIDLTVTGGTSSYSYSWSNGQGSQDATNLIAGDYSLVVT